ncbi:MAG: triose-phosphate isomerase [Candidatus Njordarchaeales archaeon]
MISQVIISEKKVKLSPPIIIINYKAYESAIGENAVKLTEIIEDVAEEFQKITFVVSPQIADIYRLAQIVKKVYIFSQHIDPVPLGAKTGHTPPEVVKLAGACGTLINHSERPLDLDSIEKAIKRAREVGLLTCACASTPEMGEKIAGFLPNFLAFEPPELIGTGISVSKARPEAVVESVKRVEKAGKGKVIPLCGAGISSGEDVKRALELGAKGVLVASAVVKAKDPYAILQEFASAVEEVDI